MGKSIFKILILLGIILPLGGVTALADHAKIEAIGGAGSVAVKRDGKTMQLKKGDILQAGDELSTDGHTAADLRFDDQTLVRVGVNSTYKIVEDAGTTKFLHRLFSGVVRVLVPVRKEAKTDEIKFKMNTPQGTIGVRGTEFTVTIAKGGTSLHGLSGEVQFGPAGANFADTAKFVYVGRGFESTVAEGKEPAKPKKYDLDAYLKEIDRPNGVFGGVAKRSNLNTMHRGEAAPQMVAASTRPVKEEAASVSPVAPKPVVKAKKKKASLDELLVQAVAKSSLPEVKALVKKGANVNYEDDDKNTPLHFAVLKENLEIIQFLILKGAKVNAQNNHKVTPLMQVAIDGAPATIATLLIQNDADPSLKNEYDLTALDIAKGQPENKRDQELIDVLAKASN